MNPFTRFLAPGPITLWRGLRTGDPRSILIGGFLLFRRYLKQPDTGRVSTIRVRPGKSVLVRVTRDHGEPTELRIDG